MAGIGVFLDPHTGEFMISQSLYVAGETVAWIGTVVLGLVSSWLLLP